MLPLHAVDMPLGDARGGGGKTRLHERLGAL